MLIYTILKIKQFALLFLPPIQIERNLAIYSFLLFLTNTPNTNLVFLTC